MYFKKMGPWSLNRYRGDIKARVAASSFAFFFFFFFFKKKLFIYFFNFIYLYFFIKSNMCHHFIGVDVATNRIC
jgi:hypothetical protein